MADNIGRHLQQARRSREITLRQVSEETRIGEKYLEALEKEEYDVFPAKIYVVSFLRNYARYLGLDAESLVQIYQRERSGQEGKTNLNPEFPIIVTRSVAESPQPGKGFRALRFYKEGLIPFILAIVVVVAAGLSFIFFLQSASRELSQKVLAKIDRWANFPRTISVLAEISDTTWLQVVGDGLVSFEGILFPGEKRTWVAKDGMDIRIGNVDGVKLYVNGKEVDTISESSGRVNELTFTRSKEQPVISIERKRPLVGKGMEPLEKELQNKENK